MDAVRKLIIDRLEELGLNMAEASLKIGKNHAYLQQFLKRGIPVKLKEDDRLALAQLLGVPESELRGTSPKLPKRDYSKPNDSHTLVRSPTKKTESNPSSLDKLVLSSTTTSGERDLPVFGTAQGGSGGSLIMSNEAVDWVTRPAPLLRVRDGYGMIVSGDSMYPKIENGATALINPHLPPRAGDTCVFRRHMDDGTVLAIVKLLRRFTDDLWLVHQFNPKKDFPLKRSEWQVCHVVIGSYFWR
jgi:phage repressor protein C with HTH and peptisase S24 domain